MKLRRLLNTLLVCALAALTPQSHAVFDPVGDDTDIFLANPDFNATRPNVLIILDNTANWNTAFVNEKAALVSVVNGLSDGFNVGLMMFTETGAGNTGNDGGYVRYAVRQMTTANQSALATMVNALDINADKSNGGKGAKAMMEAYRYFAGRAPHAGNNKAKADYTGNSSANNAAASLGSNAMSSVSPSTYNSPITDGCQKNFIIYISNGPAQDNSSDLTVSENELTSLGANVNVISLTPNGSQGNWTDEWSRYMAAADCNTNIAGTQNVTTYAVDVLPGSTGQEPGWTALMKSMASFGGGKYFAITSNDSSSIAAALNTIFAEVQSVNSVFASTTLPVSVNVRGTNLNQVYIGVFRPDSAKKPRWLGNLKLYKLAVDSATDTVFLADANGTSAENTTTGFISNSAKSYWTATSTFWNYRSPYATTDIGGTSDSPDGDLIEKGGAAQRIRSVYPASQDTRNVYTCTSSGGGICATNALLSATKFSAGTGSSPSNNTHILATDLGAYTTYSVSTVSSAGTTATATAAGNPFTSGNSVVIAGASPSVYNGTYTISNVNSGAGTFDYTIATAQSATTGTVTATAHGLVSGDLVTVTGASPAGYNVANAPVTRTGANTFTYTLGSSVTTASSGHTISGSKLASAISGSGTSATATVASHGYGAANATATVTISGATPTDYNRTGTTVTIVDTNTYTYSTSSTISGTASAAKVTTAAVHGLAVGDQVVISGTTPSGYSGTVTVVSVPTTTTFTYIPALPPTTSATVTGTGTAMKTFSLSALSNGSGGSKSTATGTTSAAHNITTGWTLTVTLASNTQFNVAAGTAVASVPSTTTFTYGIANNATVSQSATGATAVFRKSIGIINSIQPIVPATGTIYSTRTISPVTGISAQTSATGVITAGRPSDSDATLRANIINWIRGTDNVENENTDCTVSPFYPCTLTNATARYTDVRASVHGDVLHSRPAVINYNRYANDNDVYAYYGGNDGMIHAIKGGLASDEDGISAGDERWTFVPREFFGSLARLRNNTPIISDTNPKDYFADGPIGVYQKDVTSSTNAAANGIIRASEGDKVQLFFGFRRGGRFLYALDVTDPAAPTFLWRKKSDGTVDGSDTGYSELGQTWSEPKVAKIRINVSGVATDKTVLIFGGGYDKAVEDINPCLLSSSTTTAVIKRAIGTGTIDYAADGSCTINNATGSTTTINRTMGRAIFVVDAADGTVIWQAGSAPVGATYNKTVTNMTCAIPSDATIIDIGREGRFDRIYVGDTCGQMFKVDISGLDPSAWPVTRLAAISSTTDSDIANKRKFLFPPDVVSSRDGTHYAILGGTGDREHPFETTVQNKFYMFKDDGTNSSITDSQVFDATDVAGKNSYGFKLAFASGEKNVGSAVTINGTTFFNTNQPSSTAGGGACGSNLGIARQYLISFEDASATTDLNATGTVGLSNRSVIRPGGGFLPSPVPAIVQLGGKTYQVVISGTSVKTPTGASLDLRNRIYWYKEFD